MQKPISFNLAVFWIQTISFKVKKFTKISKSAMKTSMKDFRPPGEPPALHGTHLNLPILKFLTFPFSWYW